MRADELDPNVLAAETLKVSILRLEGNAKYDLHPDDSDFDQSSLVLLLGRLNTPESRQAFVELFDFSMGDVVFSAIGYIVSEFQKDLVPVMRARIGQPMSAQAARQPAYARVLSKAGRDQLLENWLSDMGHGF